MKVIIALMVVCICMVVDTKTVRTKICPSPKSTAKLNSVDITPCDAEPCIFHRGKTVSLGVVFVPTSETKTLKTVIKGKIGPVWIGFPLDNPDACQHSGITCPLKAGTEYHFNYTLPVKTEYPAIKLMVSVELKGDNSEEDICFEVPVQLQ